MLKTQINENEGFILFLLFVFLYLQKLTFYKWNKPVNKKKQFNFLSTMS